MDDQVAGTSPTQPSLPIDEPHSLERLERVNSPRSETVSESFQSVNTVRRRSDAEYGPVQSHSAEDASSVPETTQDLSLSRTALSLLSPHLTPFRIRPKRPFGPRRLSTTPHRGDVFSVDDDPREIDAQRQREQSLSMRRRNATLPRLPCVPSEDDGAETDMEAAADEQDGAADGSRTPQGLLIEPYSEEIAPDDDGSLAVDGDEPLPPDEADGDDASDTASFTLKDRQQAINETHPFGIRLWKPALYKKDRSVQKTAEGDILSSPGGRIRWSLLLCNVLWTLIFGWWMALLSALGAVTCFLFIAVPSGRQYGGVLWGLSGYLFYPFGKLVRLQKDDNYMHEDCNEGRSISEYDQWQSGDIENGRLFFGPNHRGRSIVGRSRRSLDSEPSESDSLLGGRLFAGPASGSEPVVGPPVKRRLFGRGQWNIGRVIFFVFFYSLIAPSLLAVSAVCWFLVFCIPMGRVTILLFDHLRRHPLALSFESETTSGSARSAGAATSSILLCTYRAAGLQYWKYTIDGTNVFLINLIPVVFFVIFDWLVLDRILHLHIFLTSPAFLFSASLVSIIPLAYFIGQAVASISAQSSMGLGAAVNAFFSTIVEVYLYCIALSQGKSRLVEGSIVGSIFTGILFLPGLSMCFGAIQRKTQRFNAKSAGVTSTMLLFAVISAFSPTLFYQIYGTHQLHCEGCVSYGHDGSPGDSRDCPRCFFSQAFTLGDRFYVNAVRPFSYINAGLLFLAYIVGLWFTLRTHAAVIWNVDADEKKHDDQQLTGPSVRQSRSQPHAESSCPDVRGFGPFDRTVSLSVKQVGLPYRSDETPPHSVASAVTHTPNPVSTGATSVPHVVPPKPLGLDTVRPAGSAVGGQGVGQSHTNIYGRESSDVATTSLTLTTRDTLRRRTSALPYRTAGPTAASARTATFDTAEIGVAEHSAAGTPAHGHVAPNWSRMKSSVILLGATVLYAVIAEILVDTVDVVLDGSKIDEKFLGLTLFALVPNTTEFLNAISFAMNGNIALSMEIGSAYALQVCLLQIPALVLFSAVYLPAAASLPGADPSPFTFSLLFPQWDMVTVILCVFLLSYMYGEGKSNYFKGSILLLTYAVVVCGYYFSGFAGDDRSGLGVSRFDTLRPDDGTWQRFRTVGRTGSSPAVFSG